MEILLHRWTSHKRDEKDRSCSPSFQWLNERILHWLASSFWANVQLPSKPRIGTLGQRLTLKLYDCTVETARKGLSRSFCLVCQVVARLLAGPDAMICQHGCSTALSRWLCLPHCRKRPWKGVVQLQLIGLYQDCTTCWWTISSTSRSCFQSTKHGPAMALI